MNDLTLQQQKENTEKIRDLFARAHDYIAQASHPGHLGMQVAEVLNFLSFQYADFKLRAEKLTEQIEAEAKAALSKVDISTANAAIDAVLKKPEGSNTPDLA